MPAATRWGSLWGCYGRPRVASLPPATVPCPLRMTLTNKMLVSQSGAHPRDYIDLAVLSEGLGLWVAGYDNTTWTLDDAPARIGRAHQASRSLGRSDMPNGI